MRPPNYIGKMNHGPVILLVAIKTKKIHPQFLSQTAFRKVKVRLAAQVGRVETVYSHGARKAALPCRV